MKAKKSIDRLLRDAYEQPQALPPVDDCWQEFSALLERESKRPKIVFGVHWLKGGHFKGGLRSLWLVLLGVGLTFSFWLMVENEQPTARTNAVAQDATFAYNGKAQKPLSASTAKDDATGGLSQSTETSPSRPDTRPQTTKGNSQYAHTPNGHREAANRQPKQPTIPTKTVSLPRQAVPWPAAALATAAQDTESALLPVRDSSASIQDKLLQEDRGALADLPLKSTLCLLEISPIHAPTNAASPVVAAKPHWVRTAYIGWEPYFQTPDFGYSPTALLSVGASMQGPVYKSWNLRGELWWHRFSIPRLTVVNLQRFDLDGQRITQKDSVITHRVDVVSLNLMATKKIKGLVVSGGVALGCQVGAFQQKFQIRSSAQGSSTLSNRVLEHYSLPTELRRFGVGLKGSVEYHFASRFVLGTGFYQGITDANRTQQYNPFHNLYFYGGYKF